MPLSSPHSAQRFDAFICYSRQDIGFARKLESALESFVPPEGLGLAARHLTVFRDEQDLTGPEYYAAIEDHLERSNKLIVICTPASRKSNYVNDEIRRFARLRGAHDIIPVLLSGIPNNEVRSGEESQMAFPDALCEVMDLPLATSFLDFDPHRNKFRQTRFENAWHTLLANLLGMDRQTIEQRDYKRRIRQRNITIGVTGLIAAALAGLAITAWFQRTAADEQRQVAQTRLAENYWQRALEARKEGKRIESSHFLALHASIETNPERRDNSILGIQDYLRSTSIDAMTEGYDIAELPEDISLPYPPRAIISKDEKLLLSWLPGDGSMKGNGIAQIWNVQESTPVTAPLLHKYGIQGIRFNADETRFLTWGGSYALDEPAGEAVLWSTEQGNPASAPMKHQAPVTGAIFSEREDKVLTWGEDGVTQVWNARDGKPLGFPMKHEYPLSYARFVGDGEQILTVDALARCYLWKPTGSLDVPKAGAAASTPIACSRFFVPLFWEEHEESTVLSLQDRSHRKDSVFRVVVDIQDFLKMNVGREGVIDNTGSRLLTWEPLGGTARLLDVHSKKKVAELEHGEGLIGAAFSKDGSRVLTRSLGPSGTVKLWNGPDGSPVGKPIKDTTYEGAVFSPSGKYLATFGEDHSYTLWHSNDGRAAFLRVGHNGKVGGLVFSKDEERVLSWDDRGMVVLATLGHRMAELQVLQHEGPVFAASFNHDETKVLTVSGNGSSRLWRVGDRFDRGLYLPHPAAVFGALEDRKKKNLLTWSGNDDGPLVARLWNPEDGSPVTVEMRHDKVPQGPIRLLGVAPGGAAFNRDFSRILTWGRDGTVRLWSADNGRPLLPVMAHSGAVRAAELSPDEKQIISLSEDRTVRLWDALTGKETVPSLKHQAPVEGTAYIRETQRIVTWGSNIARLWDAKAGKPLSPPLEHAEEIVGVQLDPKQEKLLTLSEDKTARLWSTRDGRELTPPLRHEEPLKGATFSDDGKKILTWTWFFSAWGRKAGAAQLWDAQSGSALTRPMLHKQGVHGAFLYAHDKRVFTWSEDATARIWDAANGNSLATLRHKKAIRGAHLSRDGQRILTWSEDGTAKLWNAVDGEPISLPLAQGTEVSGAVEGERWLLTWTEDGNVYVWNREDGSPVVQPFRYSTDMDTLAFGRKGLQEVAFFGDGSLIGAWGGDALILWRLRADYDFPPDFLPLLVQVATGTILDQNGSIRFLTRVEWLTRRKEYLKVSEAHSVSCTFQPHKKTPKEDILP